MDALKPSKAGSLQERMDHFDSINTSLRNKCLTSAGLAIGTVANTSVKIVNTVTYLSDGEFRSKAPAEKAFTANTHDIPANASSVQEAMYLMTLASDGTPTLTMGTIATGSGNAKLPERPATGTPIGAVRVAVAAGATPFDATTDALSAGHLTVTYYNYGYLAPRFDSAL